MSKPTVWNRKDLIAVEPLSRDELETLFAQAEIFKASFAGREKFDTLKNRTVAMFFFEPSTRTRSAFEVSARRLGADILSLNETTSSRTKGETLRDTAMNIRSLMADMVIMRHSAAGAAAYLSKVLDVPVVNAGDGAHAHPTQALLDAFTLREHFGRDLSGKKVTILGDILFSRVARSNFHCLTRRRVEATLAAPTTLVPEEFLAFPGVRIAHNMEDALSEADAVMLLRIQHERQTTTHFPSLGEYTAFFGLNRERLALMKPGAIIMHPGPINRGVELESEIADGPRSVILRQVTNGVAVRMAGLHLCMKFCDSQKR